MPSNRATIDRAPTIRFISSSFGQVIADGSRGARTLSHDYDETGPGMDENFFQKKLQCSSAIGRRNRIRNAGTQEGEIMALEHEDLTERIIGAAIEVHRRLGPGYIESVHEKALIIELRKRGLSVKDQFKIVICYDGEEVGRHRLDLF